MPTLLSRSLLLLLSTLPCLTGCSALAQTPPVAPAVPPTVSSTEFTVQQNADWVPYSYSLDIKPGSIFDFSSLNHTPAGKFGKVIATRDGHFAFANRPTEPVRFWGVNLCFSANFLEPAVADQLAATLHRAGYNSVRLHHFDRDLLRADGLSYELDPVKLQKLDYLFARLKEAGLYINIDLYCSRRFSQKEIPDLGRDFGSEFKRLLPLSDAAFDSWKKFARNLLTHVNPYTGLTWAADPALIGICPVNEDSTFAIPKNDPVLQSLYEKALDAWIAEQPSRARPDRTAATMRFLTEIYARNDARMMAFLRDEIKVQALLTGSNYRTGQMLAKLRAQYDYVDNHQYWDHPEHGGNWSPPFKFIQQSATKRAARAPGAMMPTRIFGKPFAVTEYNFVWPNQYRAEGGLIMPAYASLQDWDAIYNFDYASSDRKVLNVLRSNTFDISSDPINLLADRFAAITFLRRDIKPAVHAVGFVVRDESVYGARQNREREYPANFTLLGLTSRIGTYVETQPVAAPKSPAFAVTDAVTEAARPNDTATGGIPIVPVANMAAELVKRGIVPPQPSDSEQMRYLSDTGQIDLRPDAGTLSVLAPRIEGFVLPPGQESKGSVATVKNGSGFGTVSLLSADGSDLNQSKRILLLHLTNAINDAAQFSDPDRLVLTDLGALPHLVHRGSVDLTLKLNRSGRSAWRLWSVGTDGTRQKEIPLTWTKENLAQIRLNTLTSDGVCLAYELVEQSATFIR